MILFVYPKNLYGGKRGLLIESDVADGQTWFGIRNAIENYCLSYEYQIDKVDWRVKTKDGYISIKASDGEDFEKQINKLDLLWE